MTNTAKSEDNPTSRLSSLIPNVEVIMPLCSCGRQIGSLQYSLNHSEERSPNLLLCCRSRIMCPQICVLSKEQIGTSQRVLPTALPAPLLAGDILQWYGSG